MSYKIRIFTVLLLVTRALAGPIGSVSSYGSSSGVSRASTTTSDFSASAPAYSSGRLGTSKYSANYAAAPGGPATSAATKATALYGSSQAAANGTSTYNTASAGPRAASAHGGYPIIGTFAAPLNGYAPDQGLPDFFGGYSASPYGAVVPAPFPGYAATAATPAVTRFDGGYAGAPAVARFDTNYANGASVPRYDTSYANTPAGAKFDTSYAHSPAVARFDTRTSYATSPAAAAAAAAARVPTSGLTGSSAVSKFTPGTTTAPGLATASRAPPTSTEAPSNVIGARLAGTGPHGKPVVEPVYASTFAAPGVSNVQPVPVLIYPGFPQSFPVYGAYPEAPAYYGYGIPDLGYGVGSYEYGRGLIGYGLNYGYGLGTPLEYSALLRKKK